MRQLFSLSIASFAVTMLFSSMVFAGASTGGMTPLEDKIVEQNGITADKLTVTENQLISLARPSSGGAFTVAYVTKFSKEAITYHLYAINGSLDSIGTMPSLKAEAGTFILDQTLLPSEMRGFKRTAVVRHKSNHLLQGEVSAAFTNNSVTVRYEAAQAGTVRFLTHNVSDLSVVKTAEAVAEEKAAAIKAAEAKVAADKAAAEAAVAAKVAEAAAAAEKAKAPKAAAAPAASTGTPPPSTATLTTPATGAPAK